jgi:SAM-dependent methyltransferase
MRDVVATLIRGLATPAPRRSLMRIATRFVVLAGVAVAIAVIRHRAGAMGRRVPGGTLINDVREYDTMTRVLLGSLYRSIAADVGAAAPRHGRVLEVGCGPGHLAVRLARDYGLDVTGLDLDPTMIERARANATREFGEGPRPSFVVGDVAALPFEDESFDLVVSMLSMHHWDDPVVGLSEVGRVLRPGARALVWDFRRGIVPFHGDMPDPVERAHRAALRVLSATPWRWPWKLALTQRLELEPDGTQGGAAP